MKQNVKLDSEKDMATATIHGLSHDGRGIATVNNKTTFIGGALPGESATYKITHKHSHYADAQALDILLPSPERVVPLCPHFGVCGGCSLQHMNTELQLKLKQQTLLDQLKHFGKVIPESILAPLHANIAGYRRKARLGVKFVIKKNKVLVGFREKSSRYLADLSQCSVLHPHVGQRLHELGLLIASLEQYRTIPQIEVAMGDHEAALIFRHLEALSDGDREKLIEFGKIYQFQIYLQPNAPAPLAQLWPDATKQRLSYTLPDHQLEFLFHPLDFTQINLEMNRLMIDQAIRLLNLQANDQVLDLFCGIGNFTLPIARHVKHVTGIEGSDDMVKRAEENAVHNNIKNVNFHVENLFSPSTQTSWMKAEYNKILLDPPRAGAKEILMLLKQLAPQRIVYVSCNPATLARDAGELVHHYGYQLRQVGVMNMFPHTSHIEAMAVLEKS